MKVLRIFLKFAVSLCLINDITAFNASRVLLF